MGKALSVSAAVVPWALTLLGVPLPAVTGGLSAVNAVVNVLPKDRTRLETFVQQAAKSLEEQCAHEVRELGEADRDAVVERLVELLEMDDRQRLLGAALLGVDEFEHAVLPAAPPADDDVRGFLRALLGHVHGLVLRFAQSPEVIGVASTGAVRVIWAELASRPTIDQMQRMILDAVAEELRTRQLIVGARPRLAAGFVAREEMTQLRHTLTASGVATVSALQGMRGVGKSQLASALAEECEHTGWRFVGWVTAPTREQTVSELAEIAQLAGVSADDDPEAAARALVSWLSSSGPEDRLLVLDNVTDGDHVTDLVPRGAGMRVLITTTSRTRALGTPVTVGVFTEDQAVDYLESLTGQGDRAGAHAVAADLGWLPVALTQAAVAIDLWGYSYDRYRDLLRERALDEVVQQEDGDSYPTTVGAALRIAYTGVLEHLDREAPSVGGAARAVLAALTLLAESGVPRDWFDPLVDDDLVARAAIGELVRRSVVIESADRTVIALHRLQSQVIREDETANGRLEDAVRAAVGILSRVDPTAPDTYTRRRAVCSLLGSQLAAIQDQSHSQALVEDPDLLTTVRRLNYHANELSDPYIPIALADYEDTMKRVLGPDHPTTLGARNNLAYAFQSAGHLARAIALYQQTLTDRTRVLGPDHPDTLISLGNLAGAYESAGNPAQAIPLYQQTLVETERVLGPDHPDTLMWRNNLAGAYRSAGDLGQAIPLYQQTLTDRTRVLGPDHPDTLRSRNNLAYAFQSAGDLGQAIPLHEQTLADAKRVLGPDHPDTLRSRNNLADAYRLAGDSAQAIPLHEQTVTDRTRVLGPDHPDTLMSRNNLAAAYRSAGDLGQAVPLFEQTLADTERVLGPDHPDSLRSRNNLAAAYWLQGRQMEALRLFEEGANSAERLFGPTHEATRNLVANRDAARRFVAKDGADR